MIKYLFFSLIFILISCKEQTHYRGDNDLMADKHNVNKNMKLPDNSDIFIVLKEQAKLENKMLFLVFSFQGCRLCRIFENYHNDLTVREILSKFFIIKKIDINKTPGGDDLYKKYGKMGFPSWTILDFEGKVITDSGNLKNGDSNIGYPSKGAAIEYYISAIKRAAPTIEAEECEILINKLRYYKTR